MNNYYVYFHYCSKGENLFYVGKGKGNRAYDKNGRNIRWHQFVNTNGFTVKIILENLSESEAFELENKFIAEHKNNGFLVNIAQVETFPRIPRPTDGLTKKQRLQLNIQHIQKEKVAEEKRLLQEQRLLEEKKITEEIKRSKFQKPNIKIERTVLQVCGSCGKNEKILYSGTYPDDTWICNECYKTEFKFDPVPLEYNKKILHDKSYLGLSESPLRNHLSSDRSHSEGNERQLNYLYSQGKINPHHYFKERNKWR